MGIKIDNVEAITVPQPPEEISRVFAFEIDADRKLINGSNLKIKKGESLPPGFFEAPPGLDTRKRWYLDDDDQPKEYRAPPNSAEARAELQLKEMERLNGGREAMAEIAVAMKGDGAALQLLSNEQFDGLNTASEPVSIALSKGQFQTALTRWRSIFTNPTTAPTEYAPLITAFIATPVFAQLDSEVVSVIKAKIKQHDNLTDEQIAQL